MDYIEAQYFINNRKEYLLGAFLFRTSSKTRLTICFQYNIDYHRELRFMMGVSSFTEGLRDKDIVVSDNNER
jgi:hypothetical protein